MAVWNEEGNAGVVEREEGALVAGPDLPQEARRRLGRRRTVPPSGRWGPPVRLRASRCCPQHARCLGLRMTGAAPVNGAAGGGAWSSMAPHHGCVTCAEVTPPRHSRNLHPSHISQHVPQLSSTPALAALRLSARPPASTHPPRRLQPRFCLLPAMTPSRRSLAWALTTLTLATVAAARPALPRDPSTAAVAGEPARRSLPLPPARPGRGAR